MFKKFIVSSLMLTALGMGFMQLGMAANAGSCEDACEAAYEDCLNDGYSMWYCDKQAIACYRNCW